MHVSVIRIHLHVFLGFSVQKIFSFWLEHRTEAMSSASPVDEALSSGAVYAGTLLQEENKLKISYVFGDACEITPAVRDTRKELGFGVAKDCRRGRVSIPSLDLSEDVILTIDESAGLQKKKYK